MINKDYVSSFNKFMTSTYVFPNARVVVGEPAQIWHDNVVCQLNELVGLQDGWDGYSAKAISFGNAYFALQILTRTCRNDTPAPQIVPGVSGDLQIEWHTLQGDIELHVVAPNEVYAWCSFEGENAYEEELTLTFDFTDIANWVKRITETPIATIAAAA